MTNDPAPARTPASRARDDRGVVLVAVLWLLALLGGLTAAMSIYTTGALSAVDVYADRLRAEAAVAAGLDLAAARVITPGAPPQGSATARVGGAQLALDYLGETARIDVNRADPALLAGLFASLGAAPADADRYGKAIAMLRGSDEDEGAAAPAKAAASPAAGRDSDGDADQRPVPGASAIEGSMDPHRMILDVAALQQVPGLPAALMARAAPFLTVTSGIALIDPRIASPEIIAALPGMTPERVRSLLDARRRGGNLASLSDALGTARQFTTDKPGRSARIRVRAKLANGFTAGAEIVIVHFDDDGEPYRVLSWEDDLSVRRFAGEARR